jgi:hypothetical protein
MIDPKQSREKKIKDLTEENEILLGKVDNAQRELAESVRTEIEMAIVINRLRSEIQRLQELNSADQPRLAADIVLDVFPAKHDNNLE